VPVSEQARFTRNSGKRRFRYRERWQFIAAAPDHDHNVVTLPATGVHSPDRFTHQAF
jgi:hypothetical protein